MTTKWFWGGAKFPLARMVIQRQIGERHVRVHVLMTGMMWYACDFQCAMAYPRLLVADEKSATESWNISFQYKCMRSNKLSAYTPRDD